VAPPGTNRPGCARSRQGTECAESRFRASRVTFVRRQRPYRRSPRSRSSGCCSARAERSSDRCAISAAPFVHSHKPGAGCTACSRCWRSKRTAISSSHPIEQTPASRCICSSTPSTDARAIPAALPSPARAVALARANAALSELATPTVRCAPRLLALAEEKQGPRPSVGEYQSRRCHRGETLLRLRRGHTGTVLRCGCYRDGASPNISHAWWLIQSG